VSSVVRLHEWQGSREWREYRSRMGNAAELAALMDCSPWFPRTPYELWLLKSGRVEPGVTPAMRRGLALEPAARAFIEGRLGEVFEPQVIARGRISASLDGLSFDGRSEEHTSELQSREKLVCRLLLEKKKQKSITPENVHS